MDRYGYSCYWRPSLHCKEERTGEYWPKSECEKRCKSLAPIIALLESIGDQNTEEWLEEMAETVRKIGNPYWTQPLLESSKALSDRPQIKEELWNRLGLGWPKYKTSVLPYELIDNEENFKIEMRKCLQTSFDSREECEEYFNKTKMWAREEDFLQELYLLRLDLSIPKHMKIYKTWLFTGENWDFLCEREVEHEEDIKQVSCDEKARIIDSVNNFYLRDRMEKLGSFAGLFLAKFKHFEGLRVVGFFQFTLLPRVPGWGHGLSSVLLEFIQRRKEDEPQLVELSGLCVGKQLRSNDIELSVFDAGLETVRKQRFRLPIAFEMIAEEESRRKGFREIVAQSLPLAHRFWRNRGFAFGACDKSHLKTPMCQGWVQENNIELFKCLDEEPNVILNDPIPGTDPPLVKIWQTKHLELEGKEHEFIPKRQKR